MASIGIDLGTTNSLVAVFTEEGPKIIKNALGQDLTPSAVSILEDGKVAIGQAAKDRLVTHANRSAASFKRFMGTNKSFELAQKWFTPVELSALILQSLKADAERELGAQIDEVVVSVPAYFNDQQRKATLEAARVAGLKVNRLVNEPTAAALAYGLADKEEGSFLIFDLGGGTFDVSVLDKFSGVMEVRATTGDTKLGGDDFTDILAIEMLRKINVEKSKLSSAEISVLAAQAEKAKIALTTGQTAAFFVVAGGTRHDGLVTRSDFEVAASRLLNRLRQPTERAVRDCGVAPADFAAIVMVGGSTRLPMVRSLVAKMFGRLPMINIDPDKTIALGAAIQSGLVRKDAALDDIVMTDVCPFTLGVATVDDEESGRLSVSSVIERNAVVPISRKITLFTVINNQAQLAVQVYQGENLRPEHNVHLGTVDVKVPKGPKGKEGIDVQLTYDINGNLQVEVEVLSTKKRYEKLFSAQAGMSEAEIKASFHKLANLKLLPHERVENQALISRAERLYEECRGDMRDDLRAQLNIFQTEINSQQLRKPQAVREAFKLKLDDLEEALRVLN
jgi:molecular chaperone HscC